VSRAVLPGQDPNPHRDPGTPHPSGVEVSALSLHSGPELVWDHRSPHFTAYSSHFPQSEHLG